MLNTFWTYKLTLIGILLGLIAGYAYYYYVGCASGTCAITSRPLNSTLYGGMMGGLFFSMFQKKKNTENNN
jgi:LytS/YehU family sensor histidine kinase